MAHLVKGKEPLWADSSSDVAGCNGGSSCSPEGRKGSNDVERYRVGMIEGLGEHQRLTFLVVVEVKQTCVQHTKSYGFEFNNRLRPCLLYH